MYYIQDMALKDKDKDKWRIPGRRGVQDVLAVELDLDSTRCIRFKRVGENLAVLAVENLPPIDLSEKTLNNVDEIKPLALPKNLAAKGVAVALPGFSAVVKLLNLPGHLDANASDKVKEHLGLEGEGYRVGFQDLSSGSGRETKMLAVAAPVALVRAACRLFPSGNPVPVSIEIAGVAALTAFQEGPLAKHSGEAIGVIETGPRATFVSFFNKDELVLMRKFDFGMNDILNRIQKDLGLDRATVAGLIADNAFDVSQAVKEVSEPFIKQMIISRHFVERRENCHITRMYVPGGVAVPGDWVNEVKSAMGFDVDFWDPFAASRIKLPTGGLNEQFDVQRSRFAATIGAGMGALPVL